MQVSSCEFWVKFQPATLLKTWLQLNFFPVNFENFVACNFIKNEIPAHAFSYQFWKNFQPETLSKTIPWHKCFCSFLILRHFQPTTFLKTRFRRRCLLLNFLRAPNLYLVRTVARPDTSPMDTFPRTHPWQTEAGWTLTRKTVARRYSSPTEQ